MFVFRTNQQKKKIYFLTEIPTHFTDLTQDIFTNHFSFRKTKKKEIMLSLVWKNCLSGGCRIFDIWNIAKTTLRIDRQTKIEWKDGIFRIYVVIRKNSNGRIFIIKIVINLKGLKWMKFKYRTLNMTSFGMKFRYYRTTYHTKQFFYCVPEKIITVCYPENKHSR